MQFLNSRNWVAVAVLLLSAVPSMAIADEVPDFSFDSREEFFLQASVTQVADNKKLFNKYFHKFKNYLDSKEPSRGEMVTLALSIEACMGPPPPKPGYMGTTFCSARRDMLAAIAYRLVRREKDWLELFDYIEEIAPTCRQFAEIVTYHILHGPHQFGRDLDPEFKKRLTRFLATNVLDAFTNSSTKHSYEQDSYLGGLLSYFRKWITRGSISHDAQDARKIIGPKIISELYTVFRDLYCIHDYSSSEFYRIKGQLLQTSGCISPELYHSDILRDLRGKGCGVPEGHLRSVILRGIANNPDFSTAVSILKDNLDPITLTSYLRAWKGKEGPVKAAIMVKTYLDYEDYGNVPAELDSLFTIYLRQTLLKGSHGKAQLARHPAPPIIREDSLRPYRKDIVEHLKLQSIIDYLIVDDPKEDPDLFALMCRKVANQGNRGQRQLIVGMVDISPLPEDIKQDLERQ